MTGTAKAKVCYVEDKQDWKDMVTNFLRLKGADEFLEFETFSNIDDQFRKFLNDSNGPLILIIDLRDEEDMLTGFDWLIEEVENYIKKSPDTVVLVLSGELNTAIKSDLRSLGIPNDHIFNKGNWDKDRNFFFETLKKVSTMLSDRQSVKKLDVYLSNQIWKVNKEKRQAILQNKKLEGSTFRIIIKLNNEVWDHAKIPDLRVTGRIGKIISGEGTLETIKALENDDNIESIESSQPAVQSGFEDHHKYIGKDIIQENFGELGDQVIIGIIDNGIDVFNEAFLDISEKHTRFISVWDQTNDEGPSPELKGAQPIGTEYTEKQINYYIKNNLAPLRLIPTNRSRHGTEVASIAAGSDKEQHCLGVAPKAQIMAVIVPTELGLKDADYINDYSSKVISALQYLKEKALKKKLPIVINISHGVNSGGRDGKALLETAIDEVTKNGTEEDIVIVNSAGNERKTQAHAFIKIKSNQYKILKWRASIADDPVLPRLKKTFPYNKILHTEIWFNNQDSLTFTLKSPNNGNKGKNNNDNKSKEVSLTNSLTFGEFESGHKYSINLKTSDLNGESNVLLIVTESKINNSDEEIDWELSIKSKDIVDGKIHAWIVRTTIGRSAFINYISENCTLTIPSTSRSIISVGATETTVPPQSSIYSSFGPTRDNRNKPEISAPGEKILSASYDGQHSRSYGTSMAAAQVSGVIGLLFSYWQKQKDILPNWSPLTTLKIQKALAENPSATKWDTGLGYGVVNLEKLFEWVTINHQ